VAALEHVAHVRWRISIPDPHLECLSSPQHAANFAMSFQLPRRSPSLPAPRQRNYVQVGKVLRCTSTKRDTRWRKLGMLVFALCLSTAVGLGEGFRYPGALGCAVLPSQAMAGWGKRSSDRGQEGPGHGAQEFGRLVCIGQLVTSRGVLPAVGSRASANHEMELSFPPSGRIPPMFVSDQLLPADSFAVLPAA